MKLVIIAGSAREFEHMCRSFQIPKNRVVFTSRPDMLRGLRPDNIVIFGDDWYRGYPAGICNEFEELVKRHNERYKP